MTQHLWDENFVRYQLIQSNGGQPYNWLFFPGGPGADSSYLTSLTSHLHLPGNVWLVDLPNNGNNDLTNKSDEEYDFDQWYDCLIPAVSKFPNPIFVGHSFGGMFPLLFPELEKLLKGFVILNSAPTLWMEEAAKVAQEKKLPILIHTGPMEEFSNNPNPETFQKALTACLPYYFPAHSLEKGSLLLENLICNFKATVWWLKKATEINFNATWIPQHLPTLILSGNEDCICPATLFENDVRFRRNNIFFKLIENAGHMPWVEKMEEVKAAFESFLAQMASNRG